jgi:hypothetical protein
MNHITVSHNPLLQRQHPVDLPWLHKGIQAPIEDPLLIGRLVNNIKYLFNIEPGDYLTFVLGHGECHNNNLALKYWVLDQLTDVPMDQGDALGYLVNQLKEQLSLETYQ